MLSLGKIFGVPVRIGWSFLCLFGFLLAYGQKGLVMGLVLFTGLLIHEFGHILVARAYGTECKGVEFSVLGAAAYLDFKKKYFPREEIIIAAAGPLVSFTLGLLFIGATFIFGASVLTVFGVIVNFMLGAFNLLPLHPMDGGRILHGSLTLATNKEAANRWCRRIGILGSACLVGLCIVNVWPIGLAIGILLMLYHVFGPKDLTGGRVYGEKAEPAGDDQQVRG